MAKVISYTKYFVPFLAEPSLIKEKDLTYLEEKLSELMKSAQDQWPTIKVKPQLFMAYLAERVPLEMESNLDQALTNIRAPDLYLACACAAADLEAISQFDSYCFPIVDFALSKLRLPKPKRDEVKQILREQLFVVPGSQEAGLILNYAGRGQLRNWLKVIAVRTAGKMIGETEKEIPIQDDVFQGLLSPIEDMELHNFKKFYKAEFKSVFKKSLDSLTSKERTLLKYHYRDGLNVDKIGEIYKVHRTTAARWLVRIRQKLFEKTRQGLMEKLRVNQSGYESIMRVIESSLNVSLQSFFIGE